MELESERRSEPEYDGIPLEPLSKSLGQLPQEESNSESDTFADHMGRKLAKGLTGIREKNQVLREGETFKVSKGARESGA